MTTRWPLYLGGEPQHPNDSLEVLDKFNQRPIARVATADAATYETAIASAYSAREAAASVPPYQRRDVLLHCARRFGERQSELAESLCAEAGKPIRDCRGEVVRLIDTFRIAAEEATRITGEQLELAVTERAVGYQGSTRRFPVGVVGCIAPFNFPLNLAAHKVAPAIAAGCPFVLKPASATPLGALIIGQTLAETDWPRAAWSILPGTPAAAAPLVTDERVALLSFTGSPAVGWKLKSQCGRKRIVLELGGNAACIVERDADVDHAVERLIFGAFYQSGQSCIGVQRILVHRSRYDELRAKLVEATERLVSGDPHDETTFVGPVIDGDSAERLERWIASARAAGGRVLCGGRRTGNVVEPTLLENVPVEEPICAEEAFGPVAVLSSYDSFAEAIEIVNASRFGLQAGLFTRDLGRILMAHSRLEVGGVIVGDIPSWRVDSMPYGGVKESGFGREGVRYAIESMTEPRLLVIKDPGCLD
ncbi:MAG: aldehyde dehydrogenase family protein [Planctomycetales bacterium]|nr:aldehyde dehydrogenase family protein [Planctomycetales bacterium]